MGVPHCRRAGPIKLAALALTFFAAASVVRAEQPLRFWNTSTRVLTGVFLAPAGTAKWGPNQTANDPDGTVSADERLTLTAVPAGRLDVRLIDKAGHECVVANVEVARGKAYAFAIGNDQLRHCAR